MVKAVAVLGSNEGHISILLAKNMVLLKMRIVMLVIWAMSLLVEMVTLTGPHSVVGRAIVVFADPDDLGREGWNAIGSSGTLRR